MVPLPRYDIVFAIVSLNLKHSSHTYLDLPDFETFTIHLLVLIIDLIESFLLLLPVSDLHS